MEVRSFANPDAAAAHAADSIVRRLRFAIGQRGAASLALSGGSTAPALIGELGRAELDWRRVGVWQVDERVAPDGDPDRNANQLDEMLGTTYLMPVNDRDLAAAADRYAATLPARFDVVHLGIGSDGHTASWPPDQPDVADVVAPVAVTEPFNGRNRMTLTPTVVNAARGRVLLAVGASKAPVIERWLQGDPKLPVSRVRRTNTVVFVDGAATPQDL